MSCSVCGSQQLIEPHFGGVCCRACAAFFRRYYNSNKFRKDCTCAQQQPNSHPCRKCRLEKCLAAGMKPFKVQGKRDSNKKKLGNVLPPMMISRESPKVRSTIPMFARFEEQRFDFFDFWESLDIFEVTGRVSYDAQIASQMIAEVFPDVSTLRISDRKSIVSNLILKLLLIEPVWLDVSNKRQYQKMSENELKGTIIKCFENGFMEGAAMTEDNLVRLFSPIWQIFYEKTIDPICAFKLDQVEFVALIWIMFFDHAYINLSVQCSTWCWNLRKMILRDLKNYEIEKDLEEGESRFLEILETLEIMSKAEMRFHDEVLMYELNKVRLHDNFKAMVKKQRL